MWWTWLIATVSEHVAEPGSYSSDVQDVRGKRNVLCVHTVLSFNLSYCHPHARTQPPLVSPGKISTVSAKNRVEQMASEWLKPPTMVPTTSLYLSIPLSLHLLTASLSSPSCSRVPAQLHPSSGCIIPASSMPSRLTGLAKEAQAHWEPHGATQSQPRGEREEGVVWGEERWRKEEAKVLNLGSQFSCIIFSIYLKIWMVLHHAL